jgi:micrococcal nuclease
MSLWRPARMAAEPPEPRMKPRRWTRQRLLTVGAALIVATALLVEAQAAMADEYHVVRVVDGDTVDVRSGHSGTSRVRLLNIDAPETVDPKRGVECLGPEASQRLAELLPEGSAVDLAFDDERTDRYGRTLAGVYAKGVLVNALLASEGLAVPMTVGSNTRFQAAVEASWEAAHDGHRGLFDPSAPCTAPGKVQILRDDVASLTASSAPQQASDAAAAAGAAETVTEDASMLERYLVAKSAFEVAALPAPMLSSLAAEVRALGRQSAATSRDLVKLSASLTAQEKA